MTIEHKNIEDPSIHEPKGFNAASNETALVKNSSGVVDWRDLSTLGTQGPQGDPGSTLQVVVAVDINDPIVLNTSPVNPNNRDSVRVAQEGSKNNIYSDYMYDSSTTESENVPFTVDADGGGLWILVGASWITSHQNKMNWIYTV